MEAKSFVILYARQTKKKHKVWHDGTLKFTTNNKGLLYDEKGTKLDSVFIKDKIQIGDQLESDHYLITIEEVLSSSVERTNNHANQASTLPFTKTVLKEQPLHVPGRNNLKPIIGGNCPRQNRIGLKRQQRKGGFIPPLLKSSLQVDNQEIPSFISQKINTDIKSKNQNFYLDSSGWSSVMSRPKVSSDVPVSLHCGNTKVNQSETYSSTSSFADNKCTDIGRKSPRNPRVFQKVISELHESTAQPLWANRFSMNKAEIVPKTETEFHKQSCFDHKEKSTDSITEGRIQTRCEKIENNKQNSHWNSEFHQNNVSNVAKLKATVPFRSDENISNMNEEFISDFSEVISSCEKRENICEVNPLLTGKNKRTASQVLALLKPSTNGITKNKEPEKSKRLLPDFVNSFSFKNMNKHSKESKELSKNTRRNDEKYGEADFIDEEFKTNQNNVHNVGLSKEGDNKVQSSQNAEKDSDFLKLKISGTSEIKNLCDISDQSSLAMDVSSDLNFDMELDETFNGIGQPSPDKCIEENDMFGIKTLNNVTNTKELNEVVVSAKNGKTSQEDISEKSLFASKNTISITHLTMDSPQDKCSLSNITKTPQNDKSQDVDLFYLESDSNSEDKIFNPKRNKFVKGDNPTSFDIGNRAVSERFLEPNIRKTFQRDVTLSGDGISSPPPSNIHICKDETNLPSSSDDLIIHTKRPVDENFKENKNKRPFVFITLGEPQSKRFKIEPNKQITISAIERDELFKTENERDTKVSKSEKQISNNPENLLIEKVSDVFAEKVSENILIEEAQENMSVEEISKYNIHYKVLDNVLIKEVPENIHKEKLLKTVSIEEVQENVLDKNLHGYTVDTEMPESSLDEKLSENVLSEEMSENTSAEEVQENVYFEEMPDKTVIQKFSEIKENIPEKEVIGEILENLPVEELPENTSAAKGLENIPVEGPGTASAEEGPGIAYAEEGPRIASAEEGPRIASAVERPETASAEERPGTVSAEERPETAFVEEGPGTTYAEEVPETASAEGPQTASAEEGPQTTSAEEGSQTTSAEEGPRTAFVEEGPGTTYAEEGAETASAEEGPETTSAKKGPQTTSAEEGPRTTFAEEGLETAFAEERPETASVEKGPGTAFAEEKPRIAFEEKMSVNISVEDDPQKALAAEVPRTTYVEEWPENIPVECWAGTAFAEEEPGIAFAEKEPGTSFAEEELENAFAKEISENNLILKEPQTNFVKDGLGTAFVEDESETAFVEDKSGTAFVEDESGTAFVEDESGTAFVEDESGTAFVEDESGTAFVEDESGTAFVEDESGTAFVEDESGTAFVEDESGTAFVEDESGTAFVENETETTIAEDEPGTAIGQNGPGTPIVDESETAIVEDGPKIDVLKDGLGTTAVRDKPGITIVKKGLKTDILKDGLGTALIGDRSGNALVKEMSESDKQTNCSVVSSITYKPTLQLSSKLTSKDNSVVQDSIHKNTPKFSFKSLSANNSKKSNCNQAKDNMKEKKPQNIINSQTNETENSCTKKVAKSSLLDPVVPPNIESNVADCWDSSQSDDGLNFDLSFDFDDNIHQSSNNKQTDSDQNTISDNLIKNTESCVLDYQINTTPITKVENKFESISADDSSIHSNRMLNETAIPNSSYEKTSTLQNLKEKNDCSDFESQLIPTCRAETKTVSVSSHQHLKAETDLDLSNHKVPMCEFDQNKYLSNNTSLKRNESFSSNHCKSYKNPCESRIKQVDLNESKNNSQESKDLFESDILNSDNEINFDHEPRSHNNFYSSLNELTFSPDPFDQFESGLDEELYEKNMMSSINSGTSKPFGFRNILEPSVQALELNPISWEEMGSPGKTDIKECSFTPTIQSGTEDEELEEQISGQTCNSVSLSEKPEVHKIGQIYSIIPDENISKERQRNVLQQTDFRTQQQRLIQQRSPVRPQGEMSEVPLPCPSQMRVNVGKSMPGMETQKKSLLSRAGDLNGYRMHGSVFSNVVKRTKALNNLKLNDLESQNDNWYSECCPNPTDPFSPQEETNTSGREAFRTGFSCRLPKRTVISPRVKNQGKDFYNVQNNTAYYDFDPTVYSHDDYTFLNDNIASQTTVLISSQHFSRCNLQPSSDVMCSLNNEVDLPIRSLPNNLASIQLSSPCMSPCPSPLKEFENFYPESKLPNTSFPEILEKFPLSADKEFSGFNSGWKEPKDMDEIDFNLKRHSMSESCFEENYDPHSKNSITMLSFTEYSNAKQTKLPSQAFSDSLPNLNSSLGSINWNPNDNLHMINNVITSSNDGLNKTVVETIDVDILSEMPSNKNDSLEEFILVSDSEQYEFSDSQLIPSSNSHKTEEVQTIHLNRPLSSKRRTEPMKCKPFDDSITHENYNLYYYSSEPRLGENSQLENMQTNKDNDSSDNCSLILSQESACLVKDEQVYDSINLETKFSMNKNIDLNQADTQRNEREWDFIQENQGIINNSLQKIDSTQSITRNIDFKNVNSKQNDIQRNENDWRFFKRNQGISNNSLQKIDSMQFLDSNPNPTTVFSEMKCLPTSNFYENDMSLGDISDNDCVEEINDSLFEPPIILSQLKNPCNNGPKRQGTKDEQLKQLYNKRNLNIVEQIHKENKCAQFELDILQNPKQEFPYDNSVDLVTSVSEFRDMSSAHLNSASYNSSPSLSQFNYAAQLFRPPWLSQQSLKMQSQCMDGTTTDSLLSECSNNQPEILSDLLYPLQNPKMPKYEELKFPSRQEVIGNMIPKRKMVIPVTFQNLTEYKKILTAVLKEHLNIILFELSSNYHNAMAKVDLSSYQQPEQNPSISNRYLQSIESENQYPNCNCGMSSKMIQVRKEGRNKGRFFYTCAAAQSYRCKFFQWEDQYDQQSTRMSSSSVTPLRSQLPKLCNGNSVNIHLRRHHIMFYCETLFMRQSPWERKSKKYQQYECKTQKDRLYIRLSFKEPSGCYSKDDLWVISKNLNLESSVTFIARSVFYGPNSSSELQIEPLAGYSPSNWNNETVCHALLAGNVSTELSCLMNLQEHVTISSAPIISSLLHRKCATKPWTKTMAGFKTPFQSHKPAKYSSHELANLAEKYITFWKLNSGQAEALNNVASMLDSGQSENSPILLIHGVFGSGKSFLLAIIVLYLLDVIEAHETMKSSTNSMNDEKILISSTTNVAVDRILLYLLEFGCSEFIRVGSVKKIAKPILPLSVHASIADNNDLKDLQEMMRDENLSKMEKQYVRKSIEMHKLGLNKKKLHAVKIVGVTCASCSFSCLEKMKFPIVLLDECSQMTEPTSLLPLARFGCEKLLLVGDPLQLDPTIQGSEADNKDGLEQSMFDRLLKMGHESVLLRRQYRCHPAISHISNALFYGRQLEDGIKDEDRPKLVPELPTLCFYDVNEGKENCESTGSFYNTQEADFVISLILALLASEVEPLSIGVIALYKSQTNQISKKMVETWQKPDNKFLKDKSMKSIQVSTVDAFQGGERDVIILSCVRTSQTGFVNNNKRMNVALSRARNHLFIIGKSSNLCTDETWSQVIRICRDSSNSFQSAKEAKIKLQELWSRAQVAEA